MDKKALLGSLETSRKNFLAVIEGLNEETLLESGVIDGWSVKDMISHISNWEAELIKMLWQVQQGQKPTSMQFKNRDIDTVNLEWAEENRTRPLAKVLADFIAVRKQTLRRVQAFSEQELNDPQRFFWQQGKPLWKWIAEDSYEHEAEHAAQIGAWKKAHGLQ
jgi:hypothetical protein